LANGKDLDQDLELSKARERLDWQTQLALAADQPRAEGIRWRNQIMPGCSVCGESCAYLVMRQSDKGLSEIPKVNNFYEVAQEGKK